MQPHRPILLILPMMLLLGSTASALEANLDALVGGKVLDKSDWQGVRDQPEIGVVSDISLPLIPFAIAANLIGSTQTKGSGAGKLSGDTAELELGIRENLSLPLGITPFVGGGLTLARADLKSGSGSSAVSSHGNGVGFWADAGVFWTVSHINIGPRISYSSAHATLNGTRVNAGGWDIGLLVGLHF